MVVQGSVLLEASSREELWSIFEKGSENRHVSSTSKTMMNAPQHICKSLGKGEGEELYLSLERLDI